MRSSFFGIETARRALDAQRLALDVTGHNIANANTPGYSRQVADLNTTSPIYAPAFNRPTGPGQIGTGVHVTDIHRMRDRFVEERVRQEQQNMGRWQERFEVLSQVELMIDEPSDYGIRHTLDLMWQSFQELSKYPDDTAVRATVRERAEMVADAFSHTYRQLRTLRQDTNSAILVNVDNLNTLSDRVAALNDQIGKLTAFGDSPNDLLDERDKLIREMSEIADVSVVERDRGMVAVSVSGYTLVDADRSYKLVARDADGDVITKSGATAAIAERITWGDTMNEVKFKNGMIGAQFELRDADIPEAMAHLDEMAAALIEEINEVHEGGYDLNGDAGELFFADPIDGESAALHMAVSDNLYGEEGLNHIAASVRGNGDHAPGNGDNALNLARVKDEPILNGGTATVTEYFNSVVAGLGVNTQQAEQMMKNQEALMNHLHAQVEAVSGVSLDEEMTNMIKFQQAYAAASRVLTTVDETLNVLINRTGRVGL